MNKVITINLGGNAYQLEEGGYEALRAYLETAAERLQGNPDRDEILSDIERAIAEKFRAILGSYKTVVETREVQSILEAMGPIEAETGAGASGPGSASSAGGQRATGAQSAGMGSGTPRRLYRIEEGAMFAGVCNGIAAYINVDPTFVRLGFVILTLIWGMGVVVYIVMAFVVPEAHSPEEKAAASGSPFTAQEFIRRAKEGYYEAMKGFPDHKTRMFWQRRFKRQMRAHAWQWKYNWYNYWAEHATAHPAMGFMLPVLSLLVALTTGLWLCVLVSLLATGTLLGLALPANVPVWAAAVLLLIVYGFLMAPLKIARRICYWSLGGAKGTWPFIVLVDAILWIIVVAILLCLAIHYSPVVHQAVQSVPSVAHEAASSIATWWKGGK